MNITLIYNLYFKKQLRVLNLPEFMAYQTLAASNNFQVSIHSSVKCKTS